MPKEFSTLSRVPRKGIHNELSLVPFLNAQQFLMLEVLWLVEGFYLLFLSPWAFSEIPELRLFLRNSFPSNRFCSESYIPIWFWHLANMKEQVHSNAAAHIRKSTPPLHSWDNLCDDTPYCWITHSWKFKIKLPFFAVILYFLLVVQKIPLFVKPCLSCCFCWRLSEISCLLIKHFRASLKTLQHFIRYYSGNQYAPVLFCKVY